MRGSARQVHAPRDDSLAADSEPEKSIGAGSENANAVDRRVGERRKCSGTAVRPRRTGDDRAPSGEITRRPTWPQRGDGAHVRRVGRMTQAAAIDTHAEVAPERRTES